MVYVGLTDELAGNLPIIGDPVDLKDILGQIEADRGNLHGVAPLSQMTTPALWRIATPMEQEPSTPSAERTPRLGPSYLRTPQCDHDFFLPAFTPDEQAYFGFRLIVIQRGLEIGPAPDAPAVQG